MPLRRAASTLRLASHVGCRWIAFASLCGASAVGADSLWLVSHGTRGDTPAGGSVIVATTPDGRYSAIASNSSAFLAGVTDHNDGYDVFEWDRTTGITTFVSHSAGSSTVSGDAGSYPNAISDDGRFILFGSSATNLVPSQVDNNGATNVFLWDSSTGTITLVSHTAGSPVTTGNDYSVPAAMTGDGSYVALTSTATDLVAGQVDANGGLDVFEWSRATNTISLVSHVAASASTTAASPSDTGFSGVRGLSADGRYIAFSSAATNLLPITDTNGTADVFLWDRDNSGAVTLVSHQSASTTTATTTFNGSQPRGISADGSTVIFDSEGVDLVTGDANGQGDAFAWNRATNSNTLISHAAGSSVSANNRSFPNCISSNGRFVGFSSSATNLVSGEVDTNAAFDAFLWDRDSAGLVTLLSHLPSSATTAADDGGFADRITADGSYLTLLSQSSDVVSPSIVPIGDDAYRYDRAANSLALISHASGSAAATGTSEGFSVASISNDGRFVGWNSRAANVVVGVIDANLDNDSFLWDANTNTSALIGHSVVTASAGAAGTALGHAMTTDGRYIAFDSDARNLAPVGTDSLVHKDVYLWDGNSGAITLVSHSAALLGESANGESHVVAISADGRFVTFYSLATNLVTGQSDANAVNDAFLWDRLTGAVSLISHSAGTSVTTGSGESLPSSISADGRHVSLDSAATNLLTPMTDTNAGSDAFLWDRLTGAVTLISHTASSTTTANGTSNPGLISADGNYVIIGSSATDFPGVTDANAAFDLFVWSRSTDTMTLVSHTSGSVSTTANKFASGDQISADGRYVTYTSPATDLIAGLTDVNNASDTFVWDRTTNTSTLISHASGSLTTAANASSFPRGMSSDGSHVTLQSKATDMVAGVTDANSLNDAFVWSRSGGAIALVSHAAGLPLTASNGESYPTAISDDGGAVLLQTTATNLGAGVSDGNGTLDAYQWRASSNASSLISHAAGVPLAAADDFSQPTLMSSDGQYVAFYSNALGLIGGGLDAAGIQIYRWAPNSAFYSLTPCRAYDSRLGGGQLVGNSVRVLFITGACNVPITAKAVSLNLTVVSPGATGTLQAYRGDGVAGVATVLSYGAGKTRANNGVVEISLSTLGTIALRPSSTVDVVVDINGYFQ